MGSVAFGATGADVTANIAKAINDYGYNAAYGFNLEAVISTAYAGRIVTFNNAATWYLYSQENRYFGVTTTGDPGSWNQSTSGTQTWEGQLNEGDRSWLVGPVSSSTVTLTLTSVAVGFGEDDTPQYTTAISLLDANGSTLLSAQILDSEGNPTKFLDLSTFVFNTEVSSATLALVKADGQSVGGINLVDYKYVPEPATTTLSLLALAGLAARRRRK